MPRAVNVWNTQASPTAMGVGAMAAAGAHIIVKPTDHGALGSYAYSASSGTIAAGMAADSDIFQLRWTHATNLCVVTQIRLAGAYQLTGFTAGAALFRAAIARSFTAAGTGGTAATLTGNNQKLRTSMGTATMGELRIASTAALGAGTKTYDAQDIGRYVKFFPAAANSQLFEPIDLWRPEMGDGEHPVVLATNEGIGVRATVPATGTWVFGIDIKWHEVTAF